MNLRRNVYASVLVLGAASSFGTQAKAGVVFEMSSIFSGPGVPFDSGPWATATFTDVVGGVQLTLDNLLKVGSTEFLGEWYFNLDPSLDPTKLVFDYDSGDVPELDIAIDTGSDDFKADGDGWYDILFDFPPPGSDKFTGGESVTYLITSSESISAASFDFLSTPAGGSGPFLSAAHIQSLGNSGESAWIAPVTIPAPAAALLGLIGLGGLGWFKRRIA